MTQQELGAACGVRFQQIQKYECAANRISAAMVVVLAEALGVEPAYFFDGLVDPGREPPPPGSGNLTPANAATSRSRRPQTG